MVPNSASAHYSNMRDLAFSLERERFTGQRGGRLRVPRAAYPGRRGGAPRPLRRAEHGHNRRSQPQRHHARGGLRSRRGEGHEAGGLRDSRGDHYVYANCRPELVEAFDAMRKRAVEGFGDPGPHPYAPFARKTEAQREIGASLSVPYEDTWNCYEDGEAHCGPCGTCNERKEAFQIAEVPDPTRYRE